MDTNTGPKADSKRTPYERRETPTERMSKALIAALCELAAESEPPETVPAHDVDLGGM